MKEVSVFIIKLLKFFIKIWMSHKKGLAIQILQGMLRDPSFGV